MKENNSTPLWLELKKEYIDDNFDKLISYLKGITSQSRDSFYNITIELMKERVKELIDSIAKKELFNEDVDAEQCAFNVRLLAAFLLACKEEKALDAYVALMYELSMLVPKFSDELVKHAVDRARHTKVEELGFSWSDVDDLHPEILAYKILNHSKFSFLMTTPLYYEGYGTAVLNREGMFLSYEDKKELKNLLIGGALSMDTSVGIALKTKSSEKLKKSDETNIVAMDEYLRSFIYDLWQTKKSSSAKRLLKYNSGDTAYVRVVTSNRSQGTIVETVDKSREHLEGKVVYAMKSCMYYYTDTLYEYFKPGDILRATINDAEKQLFSIESELVSFMVEDSMNEVPVGESCVAKLIDERPNIYVWLNDLGINMITENSGEFSKGDFAYIKVKRYNKGSFLGKIDAEIEHLAEDPDDMFIEEEVRRDCIRAFAENVELPASMLYKEEKDSLDPVLLKLFIRMAFNHQKTLFSPSERFKFLANASVMAEMIGDDTSASYLKFVSTYLKALVQFANCDDISNVSLEADDKYADAKSTLVRLSVLRLLKEYGKKENSQLLADTIESFKDSIPMLSRMARLIQTANSMQDTLSDASLNVIKREIIKSLSLETENDTDLEADRGVYLGVESGTVEFKKSIVYPSGNNMQPEPHTQIKNVFRGICAFMNSTAGGTLYVGVNDQGYVEGIQNDMDYLKVGSIDSYIRYIQDQALLDFGVDGIAYLKMEPLYDNRVVAIHVEPHPFRVVELRGTAYLRINAESREMSERTKQELIARKVFKDKDKAAAISLLQHACGNHQRVILHNYASSNSGSVSNRKVEAYDVLPADNIVICYDVNKLATRVFNINRIGYVEVLDEKWVYTSRHKEMKVDPFRMTGETPIMVHLKMDLFAKNLLVEEYPRSKDYISESKGNNNEWFCSIPVYNIGGIARFYIGLAEHIQILDCPQLKEFVGNYTKKFLL